MGGRPPFREAARLDPDCAMAYWGLALVPARTSTRRWGRERGGGLALAQKARRCCEAPPAERALIEALAKRYAVATGGPGPLDEAYAAR